ncbi:hypothetical protein NP233_g8149 [Leucocoprinus birnbaumii]|uniref:Flavodoxin-like domain-containing protein n=1 Tax=Leucocoprinus birnbaumii TaxID=56174 RepID=A0AAD5YNE8_9AGAR|nr:hypothetical protein NP233_g8149 [Leucocoprinus birnbaumii]
MSRSPRVAIIFYSMHDHIAELAEEEKKGIEAAGGQATLYGLEETLDEKVLGKMHVSSTRKMNSYPAATSKTLERYDAYLFGIPTRFGNMPSQWKALWDHTGAQWAAGSLAGKFAGVFVSTGSQGGGQEETGYTLMTTLVHHGMLFIPLGYKDTPELGKLDEVHGGSPWGAGTVAGGDASRRPTELEKTIAKRQGESFYRLLSRVKFD